MYQFENNEGLICRFFQTLVNILIKKIPKRNSMLITFPPCKELLQMFQEYKLLSSLVTLQCNILKLLQEGFCETYILKNCLYFDKPFPFHLCKINTL